MVRPCQTNASDPDLFVFSHELTQYARNFLDHGLARRPRRQPRLEDEGIDRPQSSPMLSRSIWSVTGSTTGSIPLLVLPKVKLARSPKASWFGVGPKAIASLALKALKATHCGGGGMMPTP
jgi:hypothetical protein